MLDERPGLRRVIARGRTVPGDSPRSPSGARFDVRLLPLAIDERRDVTGRDCRGLLIRTVAGAPRAACAPKGRTVRSSQRAHHLPWMLAGAAGYDPLSPQPLSHRNSLISRRRRTVQDVSTHPCVTAQVTPYVTCVTPPIPALIYPRKRPTSTGRGIHPLPALGADNVSRPTATAARTRGRLARLPAQSIADRRNWTELSTTSRSLIVLAPLCMPSTSGSYEWQH